MIIICIVNSFMEKELPISGTAPFRVPSVTWRMDKTVENSPHGSPPTDPGSTTFHQWSMGEMIAAGKNLRTAPHRRKGEQDACFYLRRQGYTMVAQNFRSTLRHGEFDLIGGRGGLFVLSRSRREPPSEPRPSPRWNKEAGHNRRSARLPSLVATLVSVSI